MSPNCLSTSLLQLLLPSLLPLLSVFIFPVSPCCQRCCVACRVLLLLLLLPVDSCVLVAFVYPVVVATATYYHYHSTVSSTELEKGAEYYNTIARPLLS